MIKFLRIYTFGMNLTVEMTINQIGTSALAFVPGLISLLIAAYVWLKIPRNLTSLMFLIFVIFCLFWQISEGFLRLAADSGIAFFWNRCVSLSIIPAAVAGLHFALLFSQEKKIVRSKIFATLVYVPAIYFLGGQILNLYSWPVIKDDTWIWLSAPEHDQNQNAESIWISLVAAATMYFLAINAIKNRRADFMVRRKSMLLFIGYSIPSGLGVICQIIFPVFLDRNEIPLAGPAILCFSIASFIALKKYNLFGYSSSFPANRLLKIMNESVLIVDTKLMVRYSNSGFSRLSGYSREELLGKSIQYIGLEKILLAKEEVSDEKITHLNQMKCQIFTKDGQERHVFCNSSDYIDKSGAITGSVLLFSDITDLIKAAEKINCEKRQALQFQSRLLSVQLNPHFIYNSLNSIQYFLLEKNCDQALSYLSEFSQLMRSVLDNSTKNNITLAEEISFLNSYLNLEQKRLKNKFSFTINVSEKLDVDDLLISPMLVQPYVENSVIHGIGPLRDGGHLTITLSAMENRIICEIVDNGVGREKANLLKQNGIKNLHKSHAMNITKTRLEVLNEINAPEHFVRIEDLKDTQGENCGTKILLSIPELHY